MDHSAELVDQLRKTLGKMETALGAINNAIVWTDPEGRIQWCNSAFDRLTGCSHLGVLGARLVDLLPLEKEGQRLSSNIHPAACALKGEKNGSGSYEFCRNHERLSLEVSWARVDLGEHETSGVFVIWDITEKKRLEEQRESQAGELARREKIMLSLLEDLQTTRDRLEVQSRALEQANERLKELNVLKDGFVANVSHELRTPLAAVKEGASLIRDEVLGKVNQEQRDYLTTINENVDRLAELINNMLDLAKIEAGRMEFKRRRVAVQDLIKTAIKNYRTLAGNRQIGTKIPPVPDVFADFNKILQVLGNLFFNAIKFTKDDAAITFQAEARQEEIAISVKDTGTGIAKEDMSKLFQKFSQVGSGANRPRGTGIGLALCKQIVEFHKGTISLDSEPGKGSTFTFTLPIYTSKLALEESFKEQLELAKGVQGESVGLIAIESRFFKGGIEETLECLSKNLHPSNAVVRMEPDWIVILAAADQKGVESIVKRLPDSLEIPTLRSLIFGTALYPRDGTHVSELWAKARASLHPLLTEGECK